jgi:hypothetical protein
LSRLLYDCPPCWFLWFSIFFFSFFSFFLSVVVVSFTIIS